MIRKLMLAGVFVFAAIQMVRPDIPVEPAKAEVQAPPEVKHILQKSCYSCHSGERRLSWFDQIVPGYWLVRLDILTAREHLNFSTLGAKAPALQKATLYEAVNKIQLGAMPLASFVKLHPEARITPEEVTTLQAYLAPWTAAPAPATPVIAAPVALAAVQPELNGFPFDATFESWKLISTTDRGDNNTFRLILGNDIAMKAARMGNISPWPDGARFAKIAWQQQRGPDGLIGPGAFVQVEIMLKEARRYRDTEGWRWGRWRGMNLKPYGSDAHFANECTGCHLPVRGNDYIYTLPITNARVSGREVVNSTAAALPQNLPYPPLEWSAITMYVDPETHTTATLFGNEAAMRAVQIQRGSAHSAAYPAGAVLALVTWAQREDPHWFGGRIPNKPQSVEFVQVEQQPSYSRFPATNLSDDNARAQRTKFILGLPPVQLP